MKRGGRGGGIKDGVVVFVAFVQEANRFLEDLKSYVPPDNSGSEQYYLSEYFDVNETGADVILEDKNSNNNNTNKYSNNKNIH